MPKPKKGAKKAEKAEPKSVSEFGAWEKKQQKLIVGSQTDLGKANNPNYRSSYKKTGGKQGLCGLKEVR